MSRYAVRRLTVLIGVSCFIAARPVCTWGFGRDGHVIVAAIAQQHLTPQAQQGVQQLLASAHIYDDDVANWADDIRRIRRDTAPWHFVDIPLSADGVDPNRDCGNRDCVVDKIEDFKAVVADPTAVRNDRIEALKFLVHFVGDVHQPLHCENNNDRGGNEIHVHYPGESRTTNLHSVWDTSIIEDARGDRSATDLATALDDSITQAQIEQWLASENVVDWANESHKVAQTIYGELTIPASGTLRLPQDYGTSHEGVITLQLKRGGIRLAKVLNDAFAATPSPAVARSAAAGLVAPARATVPLVPKAQRHRLQSRIPMRD